jgi:thiol-disulfide isomerase/thioredoxin
LKEIEMNAAFLSDKFATALAYEPYVQTGTDEQRRRWKGVYDAAALAPAQRDLAAGFTRQMKVLILSGIWCGDCVQQCPLLERIAEVNPGRIDLRLLDRDQNRDLAEQIRVNGGDRVPVVLFLAEDGELCGIYGDRTLNRYRVLAKKQLGPSCPVGVVAPDQNEMAATLQDWLDEFERVELMLRLSPRLRQKYGD